MTLDFILEVDRIPGAPEKVRLSLSGMVAEACAATVAVAVAALNGAAEFWGRVCEDAHGERLAALLRGSGVTPFVKRCPGRTPVSTMMVDRQGERMLAYFGGEGLRDDPKWLPMSRPWRSSTQYCATCVGGLGRKWS